MTPDLARRRSLLRRQDVHLEQGVVMLPKAKAGARPVILSGEAQKILRGQLEAVDQAHAEAVRGAAESGKVARPLSEYVFPGLDGVPYERSYVGRVFRRSARAAGGRGGGERQRSGRDRSAESALTKDQIVERATNLIAMAKRDSKDYTNPMAIHVLNGTPTLMSAVYGIGSPQAKVLLERRDHIIKMNHELHAQDEFFAYSVIGALENLIAEVEGGLLSSVARRVTSDVLSDFIQLSRASLSEGTEAAKNVAAVLAAAAFEDTLRRIAKEHAGVIGRDPLQDVLTALKNAGLLVPPQLGIAQSYLNFRNRALHADWAGIERAAVESIIGFVEQLLLKHFDS